MMPTGKLVPHPQNPNRHGPEQLRLYAKIIRHQGWRKAIVISNLSGHIVSGHGAWMTAKAEGWAKVPVDRQDFESAADETAHMLADNGLPQMAEMDQATLKAITDGLAAEKFDLELTGFDADTLAELANLNLGGEADDEHAAELIDRATELQKQWRTKLGQVWELGRHRLMCGDSLKRINVEKAIYFPNVEPLAMIVTSPPYNQKINSFKSSGMHKEGNWVAKVGALAYPDDIREKEYQDQQREMLDIWGRVLRGSFFYNHKNRFREKQMLSPLAWLPGTAILKMRQEIVWKRPGSVTQNARMFLPSDERIYWMYTGNDFYFNDTTEIKTWSSVWEIGLETNKTHAVGFPVELPSRCIQACSKSGDIVGEPYCGSGTTLIACEQLNRRCRAMEISPAYVAVALQRWSDLTGKIPKLVE